jgi:transcriptional regulator with XRE-family HTH domain
MRNKAYRDAAVAAHVSNTIAAQIATMREAHGWTQTVLAERSGMRQSRISVLEDPNFENVEVATLRRLASAFDVALTVKFIPFSELAKWTSEIGEGTFSIPDFSHDALPSVDASQALIPSNIATAIAATTTIDAQLASGGGMFLLRGYPGAPVDCPVNATAGLFSMQLNEWARLLRENEPRVAVARVKEAPAPVSAVGSASGNLRQGTVPTFDLATPQLPDNRVLN